MSDDALTFKGRPIEHLSREELMELVLLLQDQFQQSHANFLALADLHKETVNRLRRT